MWVQSLATSGFLIGSMPRPRLDQAESENGVALGLGLRTKLGFLGHLLTCIGLHTKLWVRSLGTAWEGVRYPRLPVLWAGLHYVLLDHI